MLRTLRFKIALLSVALIVFDVCFSPVLEIMGARPIFSFLLIAYAAFHWSSRRILPLAALLGLARDILGGGVLGVEMVVLICGGYLFDQVAHKIEKEFPGIYFCLTVIFCFLVLMAEILIDVALRQVNALNAEHLRVILLSSFYTGLFLPLFYQVADALFKPHTELKQYDFFRA